MNIHFLQHVSYESSAYLEQWFRDQGDRISITRLYQNDPLPKAEDADILIVMGGPMGVGDEAEYPWLKDEKLCIRSFMDAHKKVIGICLGAQLIADVLGAKVYRSENKEIGWFPVYKVQGSGESALSDLMPQEFQAFHWHGDTFDLPENSVHLLSSKGCRNQAFTVEDRIFAFQFHLETTEESAALLVENSRDELTPDFFVQSEKDILVNEEGYAEMHILLDRILERISATIF
ncbi:MULTISPECIES: type 1 glutamine amidotransferase [unclassified Oceanispirochaeta]|uniref:type 1 glutamine amidotransferase n=1 Tax=unclassified Oceanispirochaeta TaxID=2635722 RepID=UPI000E0973E7|nr:MULTISPECIES: type 1 glutamine amidotransferase [unclassified Oceanispirochaeta]MBF9015933.1 type 1 glutamine amidotransferase [Oceanispirochaeta sp. M2]NPD72396.1 type 1 glutamine amidotransferase [Oceanispirochaeta sp. M1]RDG32167.1 type 1 glutamine amidotransferase [Oceanispirochaeta sp. M1]